MTTKDDGSKLVTPRTISLEDESSGVLFIKVFFVKGSNMAMGALV